MTPTRRRARVVWMRDTFQIDVSRACRLVGFSRAAWYKPRRAQDQSALRMRIRELAMARPRFGYNRIHILLRREGWHVNKKRVHRLYCLEGLQVRMRVRRRKHMALHRGPAPVPTGLHQRWSMDVVHDQLFDGRPFRVLTLVDQWSRQSPILRVRIFADGAFGRRGVGTRRARDDVTRFDHRRSRHGVYVESPRSVGVLSRRAARFHAARKAYGQLPHRIVQRPPDPE